jgi:heat shock protein HslJ
VPNPFLNELVRSQWVLVDSPIDPEPTYGREISIKFAAEQKVTGWAGCNEYFAELQELTSNTMRVGQLARTDVNCQIIDLEDGYLEALRRVYAYELHDHGLTLFWKWDDSKGELEFVAVE